MSEVSHHCPKCNHHNPAMCRLAAENRELREEVKLMHEHAERWRTACADADAELAREQAEVERLTRELDEYKLGLEQDERVIALISHALGDDHVPGGCSLAEDIEYIRINRDKARADLARERERVKVLEGLLTKARWTVVASMQQPNAEHRRAYRETLMAEIDVALSPPGARCKHGVDLDRLRCMNCETGLEPATPPGEAHVGRPDLCRYPADSCSCCRCSKECIANGTHHKPGDAKERP